MINYHINILLGEITVFCKNNNNNKMVLHFSKSLYFLIEDG